MRRIPAAFFVALLALFSAGCLRSARGQDDSDPAIRARVEAALHGRRDLDLRYVSLDVDSGVVTVSGIVPNQDQIRAIDRLVKLTPGVDSVMNNLVIQE